MSDRSTARMACAAGLASWLCLFIGAWVHWHGHLGKFGLAASDIWDIPGSLFFFFGSLVDAMLAGQLSGSVPSPLELTLEIVCLLLAGVAAVGGWMNRNKSGGRKAAITIILGSTLLLLAFGCLAIQFTLCLWLKDTNWH